MKIEELKDLDDITLKGLWIGWLWIADNPPMIREEPNDNTAEEWGQAIKSELELRGFKTYLTVRECDAMMELREVGNE